jgi:hypothetical protein
MIEQFAGLFAAFGFATAAGFNAWLTLFVVSVAARLGMLSLAAPYDIMTHPVVMVGLFVMMLIEGTADKIPGVDHVSHIVHTVIQPIAGAILFATQAGVITSVSPILAFFVGALVAGSIHGARATVRPAVTVSTGGMGNPIVSAGEDIAAFAITLGSILAPFIVIFLILIVLWLVLWLWRRLRRV